MKTVVLYGLLGGAFRQREHGEDPLEPVVRKTQREAPNSGSSDRKRSWIDRLKVGFDKTEILGYTTMIAAGLLIYFGVRSYRDNVAGGSVRFGRALGVGCLICVISSVCYVATWQVVFKKISPDFMAKYQAHTVETAEQESADPRGDHVR